MYYIYYIYKDIVCTVACQMSESISELVKVKCTLYVHIIYLYIIIDSRGLGSGYLIMVGGGLGL